MSLKIGEVAERCGVSLQAIRCYEREDMRDRAIGKIVDIEQKIRRLRVMKNALKTLAESCPGRGPVNECPILDALEAKGGLA